VIDGAGGDIARLLTVLRVRYIRQEAQRGIPPFHTFAPLADISLVSMGDPDGRPLGKTDAGGVSVPLSYHRRLPDHCAAGKLAR
jgi:hypothetical protein